MFTPEHTTTAAEVTRTRGQARSRTERVTAWLGWHLPETAGLVGSAVAGWVHWPGWWALSAGVVGWIGAAPLVRRYRTRRTPRSAAGEDVESAATRHGDAGVQRWEDVG